MFIIFIFPGYYSWEWEDERKNWNPYGAAVSIELEQARAGGDTSVKICTCGRNYTVSVAKLEQKNDDTDVVRSVRRIKSGSFTQYSSLISYLPFILKFIGKSTKYEREVVVVYSYSSHHLYSC